MGQSIYDRNLFFCHDVREVWRHDNADTVVVAVVQRAAAAAAGDVVLVVTVPVLVDTRRKERATVFLLLLQLWLSEYGEEGSRCQWKRNAT